MLISIGDNECCSVSQPYVEWVKRGCRDVVSATQEDFMSNLWHRQLAHMSEKRLQILAKKSLIPFAKVMSCHLNLVIIVHLENNISHGLY